MIYFILFCVWYCISGIGVGKGISEYGQDMDTIVIGSIFWPFTIIAWAFWG